MRLATASAVLGVTGTQISTGSTDNANAALDATFPVIESALETQLVRARRTDFFDVGRRGTSYPILRLECGFVSKDEPIVVTYKGAVLADTDYEVEHIHGLVNLLGTYAHGNRSITVTYSYGFEVAEEDTAQLVGVDPALRAVGISMATSFIMLNPASVAKEKARYTATTSVNGFEVKARQACAAFMRPRGTVVWPAYSKVVV